jgi:SAM-dependent methyltransferase
MRVAATTIFTGAFLLFVVQPLTARRLLPWFGGTPAVWVVSLLFFQTALLAGYLYAHLLSRYLAAKQQAVVHASLLAACLAFLPIGPGAAPARGDEPTFAILGVLVASLAIPLTVLSATNPLMQRWLSTTKASAGEGRRIYRLFALSNLGSLVGLWCYPFLLEPWTTIAVQAGAWSLLFAVFVVLSCRVALDRYRSEEGVVEPASQKIDWSTRGLWLLLAATGSVLLMATSNQLTRNVAAVPFLWVLPLSLYLLSFIIAFERDRLYHRGVWGGIFIASVFAVLQLLSGGAEPDFLLQVAVYSTNLLSGTMLCHGELARSRPRTEALTTFYLHVALGGALGGAAVGLVAPRLFRGFWEYPLGLLAVYVVAGLAIFFGKERQPRAGKPVQLYWVFGGVALTLLLGSYIHSQSRGVTFMTRSFFGVLRVYDHEPGTGNWQRYLWNGPVAHGGEFMAPGRHVEPILYYDPSSGIGFALRFFSQGPKRVGVVGLGAGSLAIYGNEGDQFVFYEVNPDVVKVAREYFYYLSESPARIDVVTGDGRLSLQSELASAAEPFDVLVIDAFAGDAIPVHMLTREAFQVYDRRLSPDGILAVHISNLHFDLTDVVRAQAEALGAVAVLVQTDADEESNQYASDWVLVTRNAEFLAEPDLARAWSPWPVKDTDPVDAFLWTDDFNNLFRVLK